MERSQYADAFSIYHAFFRTAWAKLIRKELYMSVKPLMNLEISYGMDTVNAFGMLRRANRVCMDDSVLHHYLIRSKSSSHKWESRRVFSDQYLYDDAEDFLRTYGRISAQNRDFLNQVYANAVSETLNVLNNAKDIAAEEKLAELEKIAAYPHTEEVFSMEHPTCKTSRAVYIISVLTHATKLGRDYDSRVRALVGFCVPDCAVAVNCQRARLFLERKELLAALLNDDRLGLLQCLIGYIREGKLLKRFDLGGFVADLSQDKPLLQEIRDERFFKKYGEVYLLAWQEKYEEALGQMTETLLKKEIPNEDFLVLYSNLSALLERVDEFIFSKVRLAAFYFSKKRLEECRGVLADLGEMGVEDTEETAEIKRQI